MTPRGRRDSLSLIQKRRTVKRNHNLREGEREAGLPAPAGEERAVSFDELLAQVRELVRSKGRVTYRALKRRFELDDEHLIDLTGELIEAERIAVDEDGKVLVWAGTSSVPGSTFQVSSPQPLPPNSQSPVAYTPPHLAERIRAEQA